MRLVALALALAMTGVCPTRTKAEPTDSAGPKLDPLPNSGPGILLRPGTLLVGRFATRCGGSQALPPPLAAGTCPRKEDGPVTGTKEAGSDSAIDAAAAAHPLRTELIRAFPNPTPLTATIRATVASDGPATLQIFDVNGRLVRTLLDGPVESSRFAVEWDGRDHSGQAVPAGVFFYRLSTASVTSTKKLLVVR